MIIPPFTTCKTSLLETVPFFLETRFLSEPVCDRNNSLHHSNWFRPACHSFGKTRKFTRRYFSLIILSFLICLSSQDLHAEFVIRSHNISGISYLYLEDIARYFGMKIWITEKHISLYNGSKRIDLVPGSRNAAVNSIVTNLSFGAKLVKNQALVSESDFSLSIDPIFRGAALPQHRIKRIVIDPGHGGHDTGASGRYSKEKNINLALAKRVTPLLEARGYIVLLTRTTDEFIALSRRGDITRRWNGDLFISIHCNSAGNKSVTGIETFIVTPKGSRSTSKRNIEKESVSGNAFDRLNTRLAYEIHQRLLSVTRAKDRGIKRRRWQVLREASCPAVLIETGFLSNRFEERQLASPEYQKKIAVSMVNGIIAFHNVLND